MATVPPRPRPVTAVDLTSNSVRLIGQDNGDGGSPIDARELRGQRTGTTTPSVRSFDLDYTWNNLLPGYLYRFWWRLHNKIGWSTFSDYTVVVTPAVPNAPKAPTLSEITQTSFRASYSDPFAGGTGINGRFIGYTQSPTTLPTTMIPYNGSFVDLYGGLDPGETYYVRGRVRNSVGYGPWGAATVLNTIAGAFVKVGGIWKPAVPYVRVSGVWKLARPQGRILGIWEETG